MTCIITVVPGRVHALATARTSKALAGGMLAATVNCPVLSQAMLEAFLHVPGHCSTAQTTLPLSSSTTAMNAHVLTAHLLVADDREAAVGQVSQFELQGVCEDGASSLWRQCLAHVGVGCA